MLSLLTAALAHESGQYGGYDYVATSSAFGDANITGCGGLKEVKTIRLETGYIPIAAAQSQMEPFSQEHGGGCGYGACHDAHTGAPMECDPTSVNCFDSKKEPIAACDVNTCRCQQQNNCYCGRGTMAPATPGGTAPLGCYKCARGQFLASVGTSGWTPFPNYTITSNCSGMNYSRFTDDTVYNFVVVDSCPYAPQPNWCPYRPGDVNQCGFHNHFDIAMKLDELQTIYKVNFNYVAFSLMDCPQNVMDALKRQLTQEEYCPIE